MKASSIQSASNASLPKQWHRRGSPMRSPVSNALFLTPFKPAATLSYSAKCSCSNIHESLMTGGTIDAEKIKAVGRFGGPFYTHTDLMDYTRQY